MIRRLPFVLGCVAVGVLLMAAPEPALAYGGPGSIISGVGALLAVVAAIVASLFGFVWFPVKRFFRWLRGRARSDAGARDRETSADAVDP